MNNHANRRTLRLVLDIAFDRAEFEQAVAEIAALHTDADIDTDVSDEVASLNGKVAAACQLVHKGCGESIMTKFGPIFIPFLAPGVTFDVTLGNDRISGHVEELS